MKKEKTPVENDNDWLKVKEVEKHPVELSYYQPAGRAWESIPKLSHNPNMGHWKTDYPMLYQMVRFGEKERLISYDDIIALSSNKLNNECCVSDVAVCECYEGYIWKDRTLCYYDSDRDREVCLSNFKVSIAEIHNVIKDVGNEQWLKLDITTYRENFTLDVPYNKYVALKEQIAEKFPACTVFGTAQVFRQYLGWVAERELHLAPQITIYHRHGWSKVDEHYIYLNSGMHNVISSVKLEPDRQKAKNFLQLYGGLISDGESSDVLLLYCLHAYIAGLFEQLGGIGCRSVLCITAPTGSYKTAVATVLASALNPNPVLRFDDTEASIEENLLAARDLLILQDDFYPHGDKSSVTAFKRKAMKVARIIGDGRVPGKMGQNRKPLADRTYFGGVLLTGEFLDLTSHSSYLRCLNISWNKEFIDTDILTILQRDEMLGKAFFSCWIDYIQKNIELFGMLLRESARKYDGSARMGNNLKALCITAELFSDFASTLGFAINITSMMKNIQCVISKTENLAMNFSPAEVAIRAIMDGVENGPLVIVDGQERFMQVASDGYYENDYTVYIISSRAEEIVSRYATNHGCVANFDVAVKAELRDRGILVTTGSGFTSKFTRNRKVTPMRPQMLKINLNGGNKTWKM